MILSRIEERFWTKVDVRSASECWEYLGKISTNCGYGMFSIRKKEYRAHRKAWEFWNSSDIPAGLYVLHSCDNRKCCNPHHLRVGTQKDNIRDAMERGRIHMGTPTHCQRGHEKTHDNLRVKANGERSCRTCERESRKRRLLDPVHGPALREKNRLAMQKYYDRFRKRPRKVAK